MKPQNFEEKVVWYYITGTYVLYYLGALHLFTPMMAWGLALYVFKKMWEQTKETPPEEKITIPVGVWVWIVGLLGIEVSIIASHLDFNAGTVSIIKTTINLFARNWALFAVFPLIGCLKIRPQLIYRAACILCLQSIFFIFLTALAKAAGVPGLLYLSPLEKIGGGEIYYKVYLYVGDNSRLYLFTPWAPALGLVGSMYFFITLGESNQKWRLIGAIGAAAMAWTSVSRTATICLYAIPFIGWFLANVVRPRLLITAGVGSVLVGALGPQLLTWAKDYRYNFDRQRAGSSLIRDHIAELSLYKWQTEVPIWGFGRGQGPGPRVLANMPLGSHHHWIGLLFMHGIVGFTCFAIAMSWSFIEFLIKAQNSKVAQVALNILLVLFIYSFGENLEGLTYLVWPGLVIWGIALKEKFPKLDELLLA